jgi:opine dehydrogenase
MKIAILGAGNLGQAQAAHLVKLGHEVRIWNRTGARIDEILQRGGVEVSGVFEGLYPMAVASSDLGEVIPGAEAVILTVPAQSHEAVTTLAAPYLEDGQVYALHPGHTFGALACEHVLRELGRSVDLTYCEIMTSLLTCRRTGPALVNASAIKKALPIAVYPACRGLDAVAFLFDAYPDSVRARDTLVTSLDNLNAPVHPVVVLANMARIDRGEDFRFYWDGVSPAVSKLMDAVDAERFAIGRTLDIDVMTLKEFYDNSYDVQGEEIYEKMLSCEPYAEITAPKRLDTRLILEDLPTGIVPYASLGRACGVPTPACDALITLWNIVFQRDFRDGARTLESMGLAHLDAEGLRRMVWTGRD